MDRTHLGIYALMRSPLGILVIRKTAGPYTGTLDLPGGTPDFGETHEQTVHREVLEETGCDVEFTSVDFRLATSFVFTYSMDGDSFRLHHHAIIFHKEMDAARMPVSTGDGIDSGGSLWVAMDCPELSPLARHVLTVKTRSIG